MDLQLFTQNGLTQIYMSKFLIMELSRRTGGIYYFHAYTFTRYKTMFHMGLQLFTKRDL